ncbi:hypothetical protein [Paenibacillus polymyxa]|uniref:hypothetical protein n=1 Tax=Paenibacillus polymyxa TaxID=1406 RepID=UPI0006C33EFA|nr:hypothetical protein [Paenibacillus polymyxa]KOS03957.1 hypothetical protein AM598_03660 [Paenibacillus polymyxa]
MRNVIFDVSKESVGVLLDQIQEKYDDSLIALAPLANGVTVHAPNKKGKYKGYHRLELQVMIPEDAIQGESALTDFGAFVMLRLPRKRVQDHLKHPSVTQGEGIEE